MQKGGKCDKFFLNNNKTLSNSFVQWPGFIVKMKIKKLCIIISNKKMKSVKIVRGWDEHYSIVCSELNTIFVLVSIRNLNLHSHN